MDRSAVSDSAMRNALLHIADLKRYNAYLAEKLIPWAGGRVLEVGAGIGTIADFFLDRELLVVSDSEEEALGRLRERFQEHSNVEVRPYDLLSPPGEELAKLGFDTVVAVNVLEHVEDDHQALRHVAELLSGGGRLILLVPAGPFLYGSIDEAVGHHRRYSRAGLLPLLEEAGFAVEHCTQFNLLGAAGWWLNGRVLRRETVPVFQSRINDFLVPFLRISDRLFPGFGMSLLAVARCEKKRG